MMTGNVQFDRSPYQRHHFDMGMEFELARAYVPIQIFDRQYSPEVGLERGTIFPELYRPYPPCPPLDQYYGI